MPHAPDSCRDMRASRRGRLANPAGKPVHCLTISLFYNDLSTVTGC